MVMNEVVTLHNSDILEDDNNSKQDDMRKKIAEINAKRTLQAAKGKALLATQIESLEQTSVEVLERWSKPSDFAKVDLVCGELLQKGSFVDALHYMERVRSLVDTVCTKLRIKINAEDQAQNHLSGLSNGALTRSDVDTYAETTKLRVTTDRKSDVTAGSKKMPKKEDDLVSKEKMNKLETELFEASRLVRDLTKQLEDERKEVLAKDSSLRSTRERLNQRSMEAQSAANRADILERQRKELQDKIEGLSTLLKASEARSKLLAHRSRPTNFSDHKSVAQQSSPDNAEDINDASFTQIYDNHHLPPISVACIETESPEFIMNSASKPELKKEIERLSAKVHAFEAIAAKHKKTSSTLSKKLELAVSTLNEACISLPDELVACGVNSGTIRRQEKLKGEIEEKPDTSVRAASLIKASLTVSPYLCHAAKKKNSKKPTNKSEEVVDQTMLAESGVIDGNCSILE